MLSAYNVNHTRGSVLIIVLPAAQSPYSEVIVGIGNRPGQGIGPGWEVHDCVWKAERATREMNPRSLRREAEASDAGTTVSERDRCDRGRAFEGDGPEILEGAGRAPIAEENHLRGCLGRCPIEKSTCDYLDVENRRQWGSKMQRGDAVGVFWAREGEQSCRRNSNQQQQVRRDEGKQLRKERIVGMDGRAGRCRRG